MRCSKVFNKNVVAIATVFDVADVLVVVDVGFKTAPAFDIPNGWRYFSVLYR
jgi:hypothetical protein